MENKSNLDWFKLSRYDAIETFDFEDWYFQLNKRLIIKLFGKENPARIKRLGNQRWKSINNSTKNHIQSIKKDPFFHYEKKKMSIKSVENSDYFDLHMASYKNTSLETIFNLSEDEFLRKVGKTLIVNPSNSPTAFDKALITIDLGATNEQLKKDFSDWLNQQRKLSGYEIREKRFTPKDTEKWIKNKILPYIDLTLITNCEDIHITQHQLGKLLFTDEYDVDLTERIRRTVKPLADSLLNVNTMEALNLQIRAT